MTRAPQYVKQWAFREHLTPQVQAWPSAESYTDVGNWVEMNEYTVHQTIGPTAYYWGYLATRGGGE
jgi:endoglucanase